MASITPANIYVQSAGSTKLTIADFTSVATGDIWESGITDVISVQLTPVASCSPTGYTITASSGVINIITNATQRIFVEVKSGFGNK